MSPASRRATHMLTLRVIAKVHVGSPDVYPWTIREETEKWDPRDVAWMADRLDALITRSQSESKPFHATLAFHDPHRDLSRGGFGNAPAGALDARIKDMDVGPGDVEPPVWLTDCEATRQEFSEYYRAIYRLDQGVGMALEVLKRRGVEGETMVVFCSDNGPPFLNAKATLYDAGTNLPLLVHAPGHQGGAVNPNMVSFLDLLPTMLDWANIPLDYRISKQSPPRRGKSLLPILAESGVVPENQWPQAIYCSHTYHQAEQYYPTRAIRTRRFKYHRNIKWQLDFPFPTDLYASLSYEQIRNGPKPIKIGPRLLKDFLYRGPEHLYDLDADPAEVHDLVHDPEYKKVRNELLGRLESWQEESNDLWLFRDGQSVRTMRNGVSESWVIPDRWDPNPEEPGTSKASGVKTMVTTDKISVL